jgi:hypothetical protein
MKMEESRCFLRGPKIRSGFSLHGTGQQLESSAPYRKPDGYFPLFDPRET